MSGELNRSMSEPCPLLASLYYITESPPQEHGGFHPQTVQIARDAAAEIARLRKILGILTAVVVAEAEAASSPEFEEALVAAGLATWEKYDRDIHGDFECDPEPGDLVWVLTDEAVALRDLGRKAGGVA